MWCIPPKQNAEFVARMEDVLDVYARPYDAEYPVVCMDEKPFQLLDEYLEPIPMGKGNHIKKYDCEYVRKGSCSIFMFTEPLGLWREAHALPHRTAVDWAQQVKWLLDEQYPDAKKVVLVMDNLNTHSTASFYKAFPPEEAFRLSQRLEIHYTPKHGSWLDMAEIELSALTIQCLLGVRIPTIEALNDILVAWKRARNSAQKGISWHFTAFDARIKLKHLYPEIKF
ncbi:MAG: IS630 family transposase [Oscillospiraceae bacterium]|nr:IS630 family transposase [Oscillospiraceae bacterium]